MGIFDFFKKKDEKAMDSKRGSEAMNPQSRQRDLEQQNSDQVSPAAADKTFKPKDRPPVASHEYYEVQEGDTLSRIAKERYGDMSKWEMIYEANKKEIKDPDEIYPGQMIELPDYRTEK